MKRKHKNLIIAGLVALAAIVIIQNTESVETRVLFFTISMPRALLLFVSALVGAFAGISIKAYLEREKTNRNTHPKKTKAS